MKAEIVDLDLHRNNRPLLDSVDPCLKCGEVLFCKNTCNLASAWWKQFAKEFRLQTGGE